MTPAGHTQPTPLESLSPSLHPDTEAYELKFPLRPDQAEQVLGWARRRLVADPHGDPALGGAYRIHSLYLDTPGLDVFHRAVSFRRRKYRLRRYDSEPGVYLERKTKSGDRVRKRRSLIPEDDLHRLMRPELNGEWSGEWFHRRVLSRNMGPVLQVAYDRLAFIGAAENGPIRLTLDHSVRCAPASEWLLREPFGWRDLFGDVVVLELKYRGALPALFRQLLLEAGLCSGAMSKYRVGVETWELARR